MYPAPGDARKPMADCHKSSATGRRRISIIRLSQRKPHWNPTATLSTLAKPPRTVPVACWRASPLDMLRCAYAKEHYTHRPWWEQLALVEALRECGDTLRSRIVRRRLLNAFPDDYREGDFIAHFPGCTLDAKLKGVKKTLAKAAKNGQRIRNRGKRLSPPELVF